MGMFDATWFRRLKAGAQSLVMSDTSVTPWVSHNDPEAPEGVASGPAPVRVIYATETGVAEDVARDTCRQLEQMGVPAQLLSLDGVRVEDLQAIDCALFLVSTTGDGDPPDMADDFYLQYMQQRAQLRGLHYGLLSLGDSVYDDFCGFGRQVQQWLRASGAEPLFEPVEMDHEDVAAARQWREYIAALAPLRKHAEARIP